MTNQLFVKMVLDAWHSKIQETDKLFQSLSDEQLQNEVSPGRNRGIYLLGHLTAVHDRMLPVLEFGDQMFPQLNDFFIRTPDRSVAEIPSVGELRNYWTTVNAAMAEKFNSMKADQWFQKHTSVSAEDFLKEPHRNKLNLIISRTNHLSFHHGQLIFLKK